MKKTKKILYIAVTALEVILLAGAYVVNHLTIKKLGVTRWMNFHGMQWEEAYPVFIIKIAAVMVLILLAVLVTWLYLKRKKQLKWYVACDVLIMFTFLLIAAGYIVLSSFDKMRAYYVICMILALAALIQVLKSLTAVMICRKGQK